MKNKIPKSNRQKPIVDEREQLISMKSCIAGFVFVLVCLVVATVYDIVKYGEPGWEIWGFLGACLVIVIANRSLGNVEQPKDIFNRPLPTGNTKEERKKRFVAYVLDSLMFGAIFAVMDVIFFLGIEEDITDMEMAKTLFPNLGDVELIIVAVLIGFVSMFVISLVFDYLVGEFYKVRRYNKMLAELDNDEDEE